MNPKSIENEKKKEQTLNRFYYRVHCKILDFLEIDYTNVNKDWSDLLNGEPINKVIVEYMQFYWAYHSIEEHFNITGIKDFAEKTLQELEMYVIDQIK